MSYDEYHDYGLVRLNDGQYRKCSGHCCNAKVGNRPCYCYVCREATTRTGE